MRATNWVFVIVVVAIGMFSLVGFTPFVAEVYST
jgi:uncharacterized protein YqhQ